MMYKEFMESPPEDDQTDERILKAVQAVAMKPSNAKALVQKLRNKSREAHPDDSDARLRRRVATVLVRRYCRLASASGGATALAGVVPGVGTALAALGGGTADTVICMKLQVDMCMCLAEAYGYDIDNEDARHLSFLIAAGGALEHAAAESATRLASKAGVKMLQQYLKGAALQALKQMFKKIGVVFTRKALEKALPFGVGVVVGSSINYGFTRYVGGQAIEWFEIDATMPNDPDGGAAAGAAAESA